MRGRLKLALAVVAAVAIAVPIWLDQSPRNDNGAVLQVAKVAESVEPRSEAPEPPEPAEASAPPTDARISEHAERLDFHERMRDFFEQALSMPEAQRSASAQVLAEELSRYEAAGEVSAAEALLLRTELIRAGVDDPEQQLADIEALHARYREESERRQAQWEARTDPQFDDYKARERRIVDEVMAMTEYPGGVSRDEYLRRRLQEARERAHQSSSD